MSAEDIPAEGTPEIVPDAPAETPAAGSEPVDQPTPPADEVTPVVTPEPSAPAAPATPTPPTSRRSAKYRIEQLARENAQLKKERDLPPEPQEQPLDEFGNPLPESTPQPDINKLVEEAIAKRLNPVMTEHSNAADDAEINELFTGDRAVRKGELEPKIREAWKLPQYKDLAAFDLLKLFTYDSDVATAMTKAVEEYKKAEQEAKDGSGSGNPAPRKDGSPKSAWELSDAEFQKKQDEVRRKGGG